MTLTVCIGNSGSGKTTFLNDVAKRHKCTYIRQNHNIRPYLTVSNIPNFDPTALPYWNIYQQENKARSIQVGGMMAGRQFAGLSGGQRKLLLFEIIVQRTLPQSGLLIVLDEPFSGVTDDFVPYIKERLGQLRERHNVILVTNDHIKACACLADNTITFLSIDRKSVRINDNADSVDRDMVIAALSIGGRYAYRANYADVKFFLRSEITNRDLVSVILMSIVIYAMFVVCYWHSQERHGPLVLISGSFVAFFAINPYFQSLVEWRDAMFEEAEALVHASIGMNQLLKFCLVMALEIAASIGAFCVINLVIDGLSDPRILLGIFFDNFATAYSFICLGIFSRLSFPIIQILAGFPFLLMLFFSTAFSPGAGLPGLKGLRYIFTRFYFWCMIPVLQGEMEGCPSEGWNVILLMLTAMLGLILYTIVRLVGTKKKNHRKDQSQDTLTRNEMSTDYEFVTLQKELLGEQAFSMLASSSDMTDSSERSMSDEPLMKVN